MRREEEGQVTPALLLAVLGSFALVMLFVALPRLLDQTERADTASDSAAIAASRAHKEWFMMMGKAQIGNPIANFPNVMSLLARGLAPTAYAEGLSFARSNGATLAQLNADPYDMFRKRWVIHARAKQLDTIKGGNTTANSERDARAELRAVSGLCLKAGPGVEVNGQCKDTADYTLECIPEPPKMPMPWCYQDLTADMKWEIRLVP